MSNTVTLQIDTDIYPMQAIIRAIRDYAEIANITYSIEDGICVCTVKACEYSPQETIREFMNYVLGITVSSWKDVV